MRDIQNTKCDTSPPQGVRINTAAASDVSAGGICHAAIVVVSIREIGSIATKKAVCVVRTAMYECIYIYIYIYIYICLFVCATI